MKTEQANEQLIGIAAAAGAYFLWGILPLYWKLVDNIPAGEILAHRILWSFVFMILVLVFTKKLKKFKQDFRELLRNRKKLVGITLASIFISINWFTYIWAVNNHHVIETSLGYYINPLVSVLLGILVLKERLSFWQLVSFMLALVGVLNMTFHFGSVPWVALSLAMSFGIYGLLKKLASLGALTGLTIETLILTPVALIYLSSLNTGGYNAFHLTETSTALLLFGAGIVTAIPLLLFASGANRITLSMIGFLQYIAPTLQLILGVFLYHESFTTTHLVSFIFIWIALIVFSLARTKFFTKLEPGVFHKTKSFEG
ncbi:EamA family transporter RarD [Pseudalkalibacillus caeni]|nr:EamA family transporter RarD [Pseudalkalibacillus caeni]